MKHQWSQGGHSICCLYPWISLESLYSIGSILKSNYLQNIIVPFETFTNLCQFLLILDQTRNLWQRPVIVKALSHNLLCIYFIVFENRSIKIPGRQRSENPLHLFGSRSRLGDMDIILVKDLRKQLSLLDGIFNIVCARYDNGLVWQKCRPKLVLPLQTQRSITDWIVVFHILGWKHSSNPVYSVTTSAH